jgi:hypothetical protein
VTSTPRQLVRDYILSALATIQIKNGYRTDVETVALTTGLLRDLGRDKCPAITITKGNDEPELGRHGGETMGGRRGNQFFRLFRFEVYLYLRESRDLEPDDSGEVFLADVMKCFIRNRCSTDVRLPEDLIFNVNPNEFERLENGVIVYTVDLTAKYNFTEGDL